MSDVENSLQENQNVTKPYILFVRGKQNSWVFNVQIDPKHVTELREDGIDVNEVGGSIPMWVAQAGLARPWVFIQDIFHFRNPFA